MNDRIAIYSGVTPSTTFIENLIKAVGDQGCTVFLFGYSKKRTDYNNPRIRIFTHPRAKWRLVPFVLFNQLKLLFISAVRYRKLHRHIKSMGLPSKQRLAYWLKYLPVVIHMPGIFHIQWARNLDEWMFLKDLFGVKIILSLRGTHVKYAPLASAELAASYRRNFPRIEGFHAVSRDIAKIAEGFGADPRKTRVIYSGINLSLIKQFEIKAGSHASPGLRIISVGRMKWIKGYQLALDAMKKLLDSGVQIHYTIIAGGDAEEILYQVDDLKLTSVVSILPGIPQHEVFLKMQESDLLLMPSFDEGIANVALEAMAIGLPVLSSDCGGMQEVIEHNSTGFIFRNRDLTDLCEKIMIFKNQSASIKNMVCSNARQYVVNNHSQNKLGNEMKELYMAVLKTEMQA